MAWAKTRGLTEAPTHVPPDFPASGTVILPHLPRRLLLWEVLQDSYPPPLCTHPTPPQTELGMPFSEANQHPVATCTKHFLEGKKWREWG